MRERRIARIRTRVAPVSVAIGTMVYAIALLATALAREAYAEPTRIRLRGSAHIDAHGARAEGDELLLDGTLRDDAGGPIASETVSLLLSRASSPAQGMAFDDRRAPRSCANGVQGPKANGNVLPLRTAQDGRFCVRIPLPVDRYVAHLTWPGSPLVDAVKIDLPIDLSRRALVLRFDPEPRVVWVTGGSSSLEAVATLEDNGGTALATDMPLLLSNERGAALGSLTTNGAGRARFTIDPARLGPPGRGELRIAFAGNADTAAGSHVAEIERHTRVELSVPDADGDLLKPGSPEEGVSFVVAALSQSGEVPAGSVEARLGGQLVGAGTIEHGRANVVVTFAADTRGAGDRANEASIELRYAPSAPWYEPGSARVVRLPVRGPSPWRQTPLVLAGLAVLAWFVLGRTSRAREAAIPAPRAKPVSKGEARIEVVRASRDPRTGWSGRVVDAHDGEPVANARVAIERPAFGQVEVVASTIANERGRFDLQAHDIRPGDELAIEAPLHTQLRQPLPPCGELDVSLVLRKRALLARLVTWARQRGRPFDAKPEPTPGHVRKSAGKDFNLARWADAVERAAFAGGSVDARSEAEIDRLAPPLLPANPPSPAEEFAKLPPGKPDPRKSDPRGAGSGAVTDPHADAKDKRR